MKPAYIVGGLLLVAVAVYFLFFKDKGYTAPRPPMGIPPKTTPSPSEAPGPTPPIDGGTLDTSKILGVGSRGAEVRQLQRELGGIAVDGIFGNETLTALKRRKGVERISLTMFDTLPDVNTPFNDLYAYNWSNGTTD